MSTKAISTGVGARFCRWEQCFIDRSTPEGCPNNWDGLDACLASLAACKGLGLVWKVARRGSCPRRVLSTRAMWTGARFCRQEHCFVDRSTPEGCPSSWDGLEACLGGLGACLGGLLACLGGLRARLGGLRACLSRFGRPGRLSGRPGRLSGPVQPAWAHVWSANRQVR